MLSDAEAAVARMAEDIEEDMRALDFLQSDAAAQLRLFVSKLGSVRVPGDDDDPGGWW